MQMIQRKIKLIIKTWVLLMVISSCQAEFIYPPDLPENSTINNINAFYIDSEEGLDSNNGKSEKSPWKSFSKLDEVELIPGSKIYFKRGSVFKETLQISDSGDSGAYITLTDFGDKELAAPSFTSSQFEPQSKNFGNCIRLKGSYIIVENLYFYNTVAELPETTGGFETIWELGALYIDKNAQNCIVRNNEFYNCGVGIKSYGHYALIKNNFIHDCNRVLKKWNWGPIGIWLGADNQEVCYNTLENYSAVDPRIIWGPNSYGGGADGGAIEIDDARNDKKNISIHHNYSVDCQGFIEVTWTDVIQSPDYRNFEIHHNVSDDFQQFIALWRGADCKIENNTIIRRKVNENEWGVFNITQNNGKNYIRNNIIVVENNVKIFNLGKNSNAKPDDIIENNLYFAASGSLKIGLEGPGKSPIIADPHFVNYSISKDPENFSIRKESPAINKALNLGYKFDFRGTEIPQDSTADIGAFEYITE